MYSVTRILFIPWRNASLYLVEGKIIFSYLVLFHSKVKYKQELSKSTTLEISPPPLARKPTPTRLGLRSHPTPPNTIAHCPLPTTPPHHSPRPHHHHGST